MMQMDSGSGPFPNDGLRQLFRHYHNGTIPPSISGIQNTIVAYAMNQREWSNADGAVTLTAASNVTTVSSYEWSARFDFEVEHPVVALIPDGSYKIMSTIDAASGVTISESSCSMTKAPRALYFKFDVFTARYSITANGKALTMTTAELSLTEPNGSTSQQWSLVEAGGGYAIVNAATGNALDDRWRDTGEGPWCGGMPRASGTPPRHGHSLRRPNCPATPPAWLHGSSSVSENPAAAFHRSWATLIPKPTGKRISEWDGGYRRHEAAGSPNHAPA